MFSKKFGLSSSSSSSSTKDRTHGRTKSRFFADLAHPDLPPANDSTHHQSAGSSRIVQSLSRSISTKESNADRRASSAVDSDPSQQPNPTFIPAGLSRSHTIRESSIKRDVSGLEARNTVLGIPSPIDTAQSTRYPVGHSANPSPAFTPNSSNLPTPQEQPEYYNETPSTASSAKAFPFGSMSNVGGKTSQDSGQAAALDRFTQRRLQRLNTEQGFREQRQGGHAVLSPQPPANAASISTGNSDTHGGYNPGAQYANSTDAQPLFQPHQLGQSSYQTSRTAQPNNVGLATQTPSISNSSRSQQYQASEMQSHNQQYSPPNSGQYSTPDPPRPALNQSRSYSQQAPGEEPSSMSSNAAKAARAGNGNRQSVHNGIMSREGSHSTQGGQVPAFNAAVQAPSSQSQPYKGNAAQQPQQPPPEVGRATPQPLQVGEEMTQQEVDQLVKDHKELREKYTKVKKYYFEKEDQVKQLQNSLAHQRLSQSRTSLDDSEYTTRFNRLDGLIAQLAFSIRKSWRSVPQWLGSSVNKDAVATGKQEMTAAGRAFISCWLVEEVFDKYFHPDLDTSLSIQLRSIQKNIRKYAPISQTAEEEENLTSKVVNWRLSTLEGLTDALKSPNCPDHRQKLIDLLKDGLVAALSTHLQEPAPSDLEGGVHMIIELVVSIAIHLPLESRDVVIEYFMPGYSIMTDQMKLESGIPPLTISVHDDNAERASMKSATSDATDMTEVGNTEQPSKKRSMLSALTGSRPKASGKHSAAAGSASSLHRPESSTGKDDQPPRIRMAAGIGVSVRGRSVLVKAPVFST